MTLTDTDLDDILASMDKYEDCTSLKDSLREVIAELRRVKLEAINEAYKVEEEHQEAMDNLMLVHATRLREYAHRRDYEETLLRQQLDQFMRVIEKGIQVQPPPPIIIQADSQVRMLYRPKP